MANRKYNPTKPEMNMTPLIDVTFQLIIFFMLVNNVASSENIPMFVPKLEDPKTRDLGEITKVVVNIAPAPFTGMARESQPLNHSGTAQFVQIGALERIPLSNVQAITDSLKVEKAKDPKVEVLLRADAALFYDQVQPVMDAITAAGIETINLVALAEDEAP